MLCATRTPTVCTHPPQLVAPLSDKTPGINIPAENDVCCLKEHVERTVSDWVSSPEKDDPLENPALADLISRILYSQVYQSCLFPRLE